MRAVYSVCGAILVVLAAPAARAQAPIDAAVAAGQAPDAVAVSLARALEGRMTVWRRPNGEPVHVSHCRSDRRGCRARVVMFSRWIAEVAREHGIDAFVLAAMAVRESGLDPFARGAAGEYGLIQLHPRGVGRRVQFVQSEAFRQRCRRQLGACQRVILQIGARYLSDAVSQCGSLEAGLGAYNRGVCGSTRYATLVLDERAALLELAKNDPPTFARADVD